MRVALVKPPITGHKLRGTGIYFEQLKHHLSKIAAIELLTGRWQQLKHQADVYHFAYFDLFFLTLPLVLPKKSVVTVHDVIPVKFPEHFPVGIKGKIIYAIQKQVLNQAALIVTDANASKADIIDLLNIDADKIKVVYLAPGREYTIRRSASDISQVLNKYNLPEDYFIYVGDGNWNKNLPSLIQAALETKINLVLVSSALDKQPVKHPWTQSLARAYELIHNQKNIYTLTNISHRELSCLYAGTRALLFPSFYEGFGLPVVEAYAAGCPVITTNRGSLKEITGTAALLVEPERIDSIKEAIIKLKSDKNLRQTLITKGLEHAAQFSWDKTAKQMVEIYWHINRLC